MEIPNIYRGDYKRLVIIPAIFILISLYLVFISPGIPAGIDLRGGILITLQASSTVNADAMRQALITELGVRDVGVKAAPGPTGGTGVEIEIEQNAKLADAEKSLREFYKQYNAYTKADYEATSLSGYLQNPDANLSDADREKAQSQLEGMTAQKDAAKAVMDDRAQAVFQDTAQFNGGMGAPAAASSSELRDAVAAAYTKGKEAYRDRVLGVLRSQMEFTDFAYKDVSPSLSEFFLQKTYQVVFISLILSALVVILAFRTAIPSFAVMFGAVNNMLFALGAMALFQIPLTLASLGALLMLIGFALDTDMLLTIRVLKREEGNPASRAYGALKTGITMQTAAMLAFAVLYILAAVTQIPTYSQIAAVALAGLVGGMISTWCTNAVIILWHCEGKQKRAAA